MRRRGLRQTAPVFFALRLARVLATVKDLDSLAGLCQEKLAEDSFPGCVFVVRSRSGTAIRLLSYDGQEYWLTQKRLSKGEFSSPLEPFYGCDGCQSIAHTLLIEHARARVCGVIFQ